MMFNAKHNKTDLIVTKKLPHTTAAVEAVSKLVCRIAEAAEDEGNEAVHIAVVLADITKRLAEVEKIVSFTEVPKPCTDGVAILRSSSDCKRPFSERMAEMVEKNFEDEGSKILFGVTADRREGRL